MIDNRAVRNVSLLSVCQALAQTQMVLIFSVTTFIGAAMAPTIDLIFIDFSLATLPITLQFTFMTLATLPAALLMKRIGRANGFIVFLVLGSSGAALALLALFEQDFVLFCIGSALFGTSAGSNQQFRFAAVDTASEEFKSRAVSLVLVGGVFAGSCRSNIIELGSRLASADRFRRCICRNHRHAVYYDRAVIVHRYSQSKHYRAYRPYPTVPQNCGATHFHSCGAKRHGGVWSDEFRHVVDAALYGLSSDPCLCIFRRDRCHHVACRGHVRAGLRDRLAHKTIWRPQYYYRRCRHFGPQYRRQRKWRFAHASQDRDGVGRRRLEFHVYRRNHAVVANLYAGREGQDPKASMISLCLARSLLSRLLAGGTYQSVGWAAVNLAAVPLLVLVLVAVIWLRGRRVPVAA